MGNLNVIIFYPKDPEVRKLFRIIQGLREAEEAEEREDAEGQEDDDEDEEEEEEEEEEDDQCEGEDQADSALDAAYADEDEEEQGDMPPGKRGASSSSCQLDSQQDSQVVKFRARSKTSLESLESKPSGNLATPASYKEKMASKQEEELAAIMQQIFRLEQAQQAYPTSYL